MRLKTITMLGIAFLIPTPGQTARREFEAASIKADPPQSGFHFASDAMSGGPGTTDPGMFRCTQCSLATLIVKAFGLQPYQFPGRTSLADHTYDVMAKIPAGATAEDFSAMLQNLLKDRFNLAWHFQEKKMKGYHLVEAKGGSKLTPSGDGAAASGSDSHRFGKEESHSHSGVIVFGTSASFRASNQTAADLARILCDQTGVPVDDQTGLTGKYDIALRWTGAAAAPHAGNHADERYAGHDGGGGALGADASGPTIFDALQQQLGLKLVPAEQTAARLFIIDRIAQRPTEN